MSEPDLSFAMAAIPRSRIARRIFGLLGGGEAPARGKGLVHVHGGHGFGKSAIAGELVRQAEHIGRPVVRIGLLELHQTSDEMIVKESLVQKAAVELGIPMTQWQGADPVTGALGDKALRCLVALCAGQAARPLVLVEKAEYILSAEAFARSFLTGTSAQAGALPFDLVTFANFPLDMLTGDTAPPHWREFALRTFPMPEDPFVPSGSELGVDDGFGDQDGEARDDISEWIASRCRAASAGSTLAGLTSDRFQLLSDMVMQRTGGHPVLSMVLLEKALTGLEARKRPDQVVSAEISDWGKYRESIRPRYSTRLDKALS